VDLVEGPTPASPVPGSTLTAPLPDDYAALDAPFGLGLYGAIGLVADAGIPGGGEVDAGTIPVRGAMWTFSVASAVSPLFVNPADNASMIEGMTAFTASVDGGTPLVLSTFRGGSALVQMNPNVASNAAIFEVH
jgi:hypothetical protein